MDVVTEQPITTRVNEDLPPGYSERPTTGLLNPGYDGAYGRPLGSSQGEFSTSPLQWMPIPTNVPLNCPSGLEYLTAVDQIFVDQLVEYCEFHNATKFKILNSMDQQVYFATEESEYCERYCYKNARGFKMRIWDNYGREVMRVVRPLQGCAGCCWCADKVSCSLYIEVEAPVGQVIGRVKQTKTWCTANYDIVSPFDDVLLKIRGPTCPCDGACCTKDQDFGIHIPDLNTEIGKISKRWGGFFREMCTYSDKFGISFPLDLDVKMKATLFGAVFLIDFMLFEKRK